MHAPKPGYYILGIGILIVVFSLTADFIGIGKSGIQAAQLLLLQIGILVAFLGLGIILARGDGKFSLSMASRRVLDGILNLPVIVWVVLGFLIIYILLFILPNFFNPEHRIQYFNRFIPEAAPIGRDLIASTNSIRNWFVSGEKLYDTENYEYPLHVYPPLYAVVFAPILLLRYPENYYFVTAVTFCSMIFLTLFLPDLFKAGSYSSLNVFFFLTVIASYGMQFEFERGQFNIISTLLCFLAIYLFHYRESFRYLSYLLFSVSIHLKLYPAIFLLMFVKDWRDWKGNLMRFLGLGLFNVALLFVLGPSAIIDYINILAFYTGATWSRPYNHSIKSFVYDLTNPDTGLLKLNTAAWVKDHMLMIEFLLIALFLACLLAVVVKAYRNKERGINLDLLMICTIGAMILPSVSIDYKLPLLAPPLAMALSRRPMQAGRLRKTMTILLVIILSAAYSVTLFSFIDRPVFLANSLPMLIVILTAVTLLNYIDDGAISDPSLVEKIPG